MPNHITNELTAAKHILDSLKSSKSELDFETVAPMPEVLKGEPHSGVTQWAEIAMGIVNLKTLAVPALDPLAAFQRQDYGAASISLRQSNAIRSMTEGPFPIDWKDSDFEQLIRCMRGLREYGYASWYEWSIANWGTKWNAYSIKRINDTTIKFKTAWNAPLKWLAKLAEKFPGEQISIRWADEDFGSNVGTITIKADGELDGTPIPDDSPEAHKLAMELLYGNVIPEHMRAGQDGRYVYTED
jgi:hypothetical protein